MPKLDDYFLIAEAAEYLGVCQNTLRNWGANGKLKNDAIQLMDTAST